MSYRRLHILKITEFIYLPSEISIINVSRHSTILYYSQNIGQKLKFLLIILNVMFSCNLAIQAHTKQQKKFIECQCPAIVCRSCFGKLIVGKMYSEDLGFFQCRIEFSGIICLYTKNGNCLYILTCNYYSARHN